MILPSIFLDSDVVISSLISQTGAANYLLQQKEPRKYISDYSVKEMGIVVNRLNLDTNRYKAVLTKLTISKIGHDMKEIKEKYGLYVSDPNDTHVIAGAKESKVKFLITYNLKHYKIDKIKFDLDILITTPARYLQYLRSL